LGFSKKPQKCLEALYYEIFINNISHLIELGSITGSEIRRIGNIPPDHIIKFQILERTDLLIEIGDDDSVDLTRPGAEHFFSENSIEHVH
jgi:hypothetical protein